MISIYWTIHKISIWQVLRPASNILFIFIIEFAGNMHVKFHTLGINACAAFFELVSIIINVFITLNDKKHRAKLCLFPFIYLSIFQFQAQQP